MQSVTIIGWDCASQPPNNGLALAQWRPGENARLESVVVPRSDDELLGIVREACDQAAAVLFAADIPLGWPAESSDRLATHRAGDGMQGEIDPFFRRLTDREIHRRLRKLPLEINGDRIGRAAWATLRRLHLLREATGQSIPLAWSPQLEARVSLIEVYPGGTRIAHGWPKKLSAKHTAREKLAAREQLLSHMPVVIDGQAREIALANHDALDAVLCVVAAIDFLERRAIAPTRPQLKQAQREGWIWSAGSSR